MILHIAKKVELINKHKFIDIALDKNANTFVIHIATLEALELAISMNLLRALLPVVLQQEGALSEIPREYKEHTDVISPDLAIELSKNTRINKHVIELVENK